MLTQSLRSLGHVMQVAGSHCSWTCRDHRSGVPFNVSTRQLVKNEDRLVILCSSWSSQLYRTNLTHLPTVLTLDWLEMLISTFFKKSLQNIMLHKTPGTTVTLLGLKMMMFVIFVEVKRKPSEYFRECNFFVIFWGENAKNTFGINIRVLQRRLLMKISFWILNAIILQERYCIGFNFTA